MYRGCKLFLSEDGLEVVRVDCGIASIPPFRIDVLLSSESIWFCAEITRVEPDDKIELGKVLRLLCLPLGQYFGSRKILKVLMICNNVNGIDQTFQIVSLKLNVLDFLGFWPILNNLYFVVRHGKARKRKDVFQILY